MRSLSSVLSSSEALVPGGLLRLRDSREVRVSVRRDSAFCSFLGLALGVLCMGSRKDAMKVRAMREASRSVHCSPGGSQKGDEAITEVGCGGARLTAVV